MSCVRTKTDTVAHVYNLEKALLYLKNKNKKNK